MKKFISLMPAVFFILISTAYSQSLADLANKEKNRREEIKGDIQVITNEQTARYSEGAVTTGQAPAVSPAAKEAEDAEADESGADKPQSDKINPDEPVDFQGRPESYWRKTMAEARQKVKDLEDENKVLKLKMAELQTRFYNIDDGFARESVQREIQKTIYEQDLNETNLKKAREELEDLEKEARKSGALPGWIGK